MAFSNLCFRIICNLYILWI